MRKLQIRFLFIIATFAFLCSGCAKKPWQLVPANPSSGSMELLIISGGNYYGFLGHAGLKTEYGIFHFCVLEGDLMVEHMEASSYFKLYNDYEQRDIYAIELDLSGTMRKKILEEAIQLCGHPFPPAPRYSLVSNNCISGLWHLLAVSSGLGLESKSLGIPTPENLRKWALENIPNRGEKIYPSYRHRKMFEKVAKGNSLGSDFFIPTTDTNTHNLQCWRLVYTEDLRGAAFFLRPIAGVGNIVAGAGQSITGVIGIPVGRMPEFFKGLGAILMALPELVFISARKAGKCAPMEISEIRGIVEKWTVTDCIKDKSKRNKVRKSNRSIKTGSKSHKKHPSLRQKRKARTNEP